jgi:molybdate transport system ATP-binding protein
MSQNIHARFRLDRGDFSLDIDLVLPGQGITAIFGPSGSGKTTCLRAMAGLEHAPGGLFRIGDDVWQDDQNGVFVPTYQRAIGYVFQEASLFAHLSVRRNIEFGQKRVPAASQRFDLATVADLVGIAGLLERMPHSLSGGERQRVAIARALMAAPRLLLMDEPLAGLDRKRKMEIMPYLERLHDEMSIPIIYVSHAADEVARLADHLVLIDGGRVVAKGPLAETMARADLPPAFTDDAGVVLEATLAGHEADQLSRLDFVDGYIRVGLRAEAPGSRLRCRIRARDVSIALERARASSILNILPATVTAIAETDSPGHVLVQMRVGSTLLLARITERSRRELGIAPGQSVWAQIKAVALLT